MTADHPPAARHSVARATALAIAAAILLVPANVLPVLSTSNAGEERTDTIFSGAKALWDDGLWPLAAIVFLASIVIPVLKLVGLGWLLVAARRPVGRARARRLTRLYGALDFIGRWSMLDVFLAAFLTGVVRFGLFAHAEAEPGIVAFAAAVVLTMLATRAFAPAVFWEPRARLERMRS
ncbi:paraquat-inducible protein A [Opitutus terrae]|uniref:Paraquat-inducible protein A n=1 Tax=Opitutus terrae (strain DSM 11246 / JCM 15787 / PB90-1) TaxID=452637 RepID=B1ZMH0_OPITP|nr:paraquat-inducible protein A [Opitutus terrae]ACB73423.1 Paraquat-inducible protein A [Opitutus terrae PB90-1]